MYKKTSLTKLWLIIVCAGSFFFLYKSSIRAFATRVFTLESSQNALVLLKKIEKTFEQALRHMLLAIFGYQDVMQQQKEVWKGVEELLNKMPLEIAQLQAQINLLAKDNDDYTELINRLFILLNQMTAQVQIYSDYMKTIDAGLLAIMQQQKSAQALVNDLATLCE